MRGINGAPVSTPPSGLRFIEVSTLGILSDKIIETTKLAKTKVVKESTHSMSWKKLDYTHCTLSSGERPDCGSALTRTPSIVLQSGQGGAASAGVGAGSGQNKVNGQHAARVVVPGDFRA